MYKFSKVYEKSSLYQWWQLFALRKQGEWNEARPHCKESELVKGYGVIGSCCSDLQISDSDSRYVGMPKKTISRYFPFNSVLFPAVLLLVSRNNNKNTNNRSWGGGRGGGGGGGDEPSFLI